MKGTNERRDLPTPFAPAGVFSPPVWLAATRGAWRGASFTGRFVERGGSAEIVINGVAYYIYLDRMHLGGAGDEIGDWLRAKDEVSAEASNVA